ncbi:lytic murein transglycosylase B [Tolypothrix campylonemoides VB511288]|nr:lytic murein transglycosylase B [Tolypothrix campylonemoides VB511288]
MIRRTDARRACIGALTVLLAACATRSPSPAPAPPTQAPATTPPPSAVNPPASSTVLPLPDAATLAAARAAFVRDTSARFDIPAADIERVLAQATLRESIVNAMARPAEAKPWRDYRPIFITDARIRGGREFLAAHRDALMRVQARTGVPAEIIVAILGVETSFGANTGRHRVLDALYTLAFAYPRTGDPARAEREARRAAFFRDELAQLFALQRETGFDIAALTGSYAGAMGWGQFMPSSYRNYAVDGDGDGRRDLFASLDDVFASVANYFVLKGGWQPGAPVAVRATMAPGSADWRPDGLENVYTLDALAARGFTPAQPIVAPSPATVIRLEGAQGLEHWIGFQNFYAITRYNISAHYAMAVFQLAEAIAGRDVTAPPAPPPTGSPAA